MIRLFCRKCQISLVEYGDSRVCSACGATWQTVGGVLKSPIGSPTNQSGSSEAFFDQYHGERDTDESSRKQWWYQNDSLDPGRILAPLVARTTPQVVVELGCGTGTNLATVQSVHPRVSHLVGCDVSFQALTLAKMRLSNEPTAADLLLVHADGTQLPLDSQCADLVLLINVLHHATDLSLVGDAARLVRPRGTVLIIDISSKSILNNASRFVWRFLPQSLRRRFAHDLLVDDEAPTVRLVNPDLLDAFATQNGMLREGHESMGLFLFLIQHLFIMFPNLGRWFPKTLWNGLESLERRAMTLPLLAGQCAFFSVRYRTAPFTPTAP